MCKIVDYEHDNTVCDHILYSCEDKIIQRFKFTDQDIISQYISRFYKIYTNYKLKILIIPVDHIYLTLRSENKRIYKSEQFSCDLCKILITRRVRDEHTSYLCKSCVTFISHVKFHIPEPEIEKSRFKIDKSTFTTEQLKEYFDKSYDLYLKLKSGQLLLEVPKDYIKIIIKNTNINSRKRNIKGERFTCQGFCEQVIERVCKNNYKSYMCHTCVTIVINAKYDAKGREERRKEINSTEKKWRKNNREKVKRYRKTHNSKESTKENTRKRKRSKKYKDTRKAYIKNKLDTDPIYRMMYNARHYVYNTLRKTPFKKHAHFEELVGCHPFELREHLEKQFTNEMSWDNYGSLWEIDHIIPTSSFKLGTLEDQQKAFSYLNMQPLKIQDNRRKNNYIIPSHTPESIEKVLDKFFDTLTGVI